MEIKVHYVILVVQGDVEEEGSERINLCCFFLLL